MSRKSLNDYEIKSLAKSLASLNLSKNDEERIMIENLLNNVRKKIKINRTNVLDKILSESEENELKNKIKDDPEYEDLFKEQSEPYMKDKYIKSLELNVNVLKNEVDHLRELNALLKKELQSKSHHKSSYSNNH